VQDAAERAVVRLVSSRVNGALIEGFKAFSWLPVGPLPPAKSPYVLELLQVVQVKHCNKTTQACMVASQEFGTFSSLIVDSWTG
jgi:hypothetical protein